MGERLALTVTGVCDDVEYVTWRRSTTAGR